jgi:hypothetical protein|tara:strand:- start:676 stop:903 length:228 start_codon:yes stop_codon:yes gene_type:complete
MSIIKAFFGLNKIPKIVKFNEFKSFDEVNQMGGGIAAMREKVKKEKITLTKDQKDFLEDQMKQVEMVFDMIKGKP